MIVRKPNQRRSRRWVVGSEGCTDGGSVTREVSPQAARLRGRRADVDGNGHRAVGLQPNFCQSWVLSSQLEEPTACDGPVIRGRCPIAYGVAISGAGAFLFRVLYTGGTTVGKDFTRA